MRKKLKQPSFAAKVDRDQIRRGIEELGVDESEHIQLVIDAMAARADELGLAPPSVPPAVRRGIAIGRGGGPPGLPG